MVDDFLNARRPSSRMKAVVSVGGAVIGGAVEDGDLDAYVDAFEELAAATETLVIVTGAGPLKRYIDAVPGEVSEARRDLIGIQATRLHASTLAAALDANAGVPSSLEEVDRMVRTHDVVVMGGLLAGQSTDAVAAVTAELVDADRLVLATTVDGVYTGDPEEDPDAERLDAVSYADLLDLLVEQRVGAGEYALMDLTAAKVIERSRIPAAVVDGRDPDTVARCLGDDHGGTRIVPE